MNLKKVILSALLLTSILNCSIGQTVLFEDNNHAIYYEYIDTNIVITIEDFFNTSFESSAIPDSSAMDYVLLQFDHNQNGLIDNGIDKYYTYNPLLINNSCVGDIQSSSQISACGTNSNGSVSASIKRSIKKNVDHLVVQFNIPQVELFSGLNLCTRFSVKLHKSGDLNTVTTDLPSASSATYFVTDYFVLPLFTPLDLGNDKTICAGDTIASNTYYPNYSWNTGSIDSFIIPQDSGIFTLEVSDNTCSMKDTIAISKAANYICSGNAILFPSAVTPNNDGINDFFEPVPNTNLHSIDFSKASLTIYNRWGILVGGKTGLPPFWDCYLDWGQKAPSGTYFYSFSPTGNTTDVINGFFTLIYTER